MRAIRGGSLGVFRYYERWELACLGIQWTPQRWLQRMMEAKGGLTSMTRRRTCSTESGCKNTYYMLANTPLAGFVTSLQSKSLVVNPLRMRLTLSL